MKQNHQIVQDFLKTSHKAVYNLAKPTGVRGSDVSNAGGQQSAMGDQSMISEAMDVGSDWIAELTKMESFG